MNDATSPDGTFLTSLVAPPPVVNGYSIVQKTGANANRIEMVFLGDGYTAGQLGTTYLDHVGNLVDYLFSGGLLTDPFGRYHNFFNIYAVNVVSNESGADKETPGKTVDTALGATFYADGVTHRLLDVDVLLAGQALTAGLQGTGIVADMKFVTVNTSVYGGAGGTYATFAGGNAQANELALHEMAHAFVGLADEYTAAGSGGQNGSVYTGGEPFQANVTKSATGEKWAEWLGYDQPGIGVIGAYEGAAYYQSGIYRPSENSKMRSLGQPFDAIAREQFVLRFYDIVDPIDSATPGTDLTDPDGLDVQVIDPEVISLRWTVDGKVVSDAAVEHFDFASFNIASGTHELSALAYDPTDWVRAADRSSLQQLVEWTVTLTIATLQARGAEPLLGGPLIDKLLGDAAANLMAGGAGNDWLTGAGGDDVLDGGEGIDTAFFADALKDCVITFDGDVCVVTTATEGVDRLSDIEFANFAGAVEAIVPASDAGTFRLVASAGLVAEVGGGGFVMGSREVQDIAVFDRPGAVSFDASFNAGGDFIRLEKAAAAYTIFREGSAAQLTDGDSIVTVPFGTTATYLVFADGMRSLLYDQQSATARIGGQSFATLPVAITAAGETAPAPSGDAQAKGRLWLSQEAEVAAGGRLDVFGSNAAERLELHSGDVRLDPSFNRGGDMLLLDMAAQDYTAARQGSSVVIAGGDLVLTVPVGTAGTTIEFAGDSRVLLYDTQSGQVLIDDQPIAVTPTILNAAFG